MTATRGIPALVKGAAISSLARNCNFAGTGIRQLK
jgi:hypothetical protein